MFSGKRHSRNLDHLGRVTWPPEGGVHAAAGQLKFDEVLTDVIGVFPVLPQFRSLANSASKAGAAAATNADYTAVPEDTIRVVQAIQVSHNDAAARDLSINILRPNGILTAIAYQTAVATNVLLILNRQITLAAGDIIRLSANGMAVGANLQSYMQFIDLPEGFMYPNLG